MYRSADPVEEIIEVWKVLAADLESARLLLFEIIQDLEKHNGRSTNTF
ncbi:hypothetical protein J0B03_03640 [Alkalibacter rhizosphaerae]|uniref:Uncharacterized protein n=1 Tax=Alkalibacter rhizosphaerae TaxID=2815577 RepID=A0A975AIZ1_9FIRM|nr:hypothetical protein [Alkalibacter rhizosphaerae]QSX09174.1 hypothetical protein J0B03_03640 [Alkalibacter rhizosphaerae]